MKPNLTPPGTKPLKLNRDILLSTAAVEFNLRRYTVANALAIDMSGALAVGQGLTVVHCSAQLKHFLGEQLVRFSDKTSSR
jgi:hypothetical protein